MDWRRRERLFYGGAPLAIFPALALLPAFVFLVFSPRVPHATVWAVIVFPLIAVAEFFGLYKLARGSGERPFSLLTMLSFGVMLVLVVIVTYTGILLGALVDRM
jgi:hypothetical protein